MALSGGVSRHADSRLQLGEAPCRRPRPRRPRVAPGSPSDSSRAPDSRERGGRAASSTRTSARPGRVGRQRARASRESGPGRAERPRSARIDVDEHPGGLRDPVTPSPRRRSPGCPSPCATRNRSITSNSAAARPSIRTTAPFSIAGSGSGRSGLRATRPSSGSGVTSSSRRSSLVAREAKRPDTFRQEEPSISHRRPLPHGRRLPSGAPPRRRASVPTPRAHPGSNVQGEGPCRSRAADHPERRQARQRGRDCRPAASRPAVRATSAWRRNCCRRRTNVGSDEGTARAASSITSSSASPDGVSTRSGRREPMDVDS